MGVFYAAVDGDPLTSHPDSHVIAGPGSHSATVVGEGGKARSLVYIGDSAWCGACRSFGRIVGGAGVSDKRRMIDLTGGGRRQAVGEDQVLCKCPTLPRIIPLYGRRWKVVNDVATQLPFMSASFVSTPALFDEQFTLMDVYGVPMAGAYYTVRLPSGEVRQGIADEFGQTLRFQTQDVQNITVYLGHLECL